MTAARVTSEDNEEAIDAEEVTMTTGDVAESMIAIVEEAIDESPKEDIEEDRFVLHTIYEEDEEDNSLENDSEENTQEDSFDNTQLYDKSWERVMRLQHKHDNLDCGKHNGLDRGLDYEQDQVVQYYAQINPLGSEPRTPQVTQRRLAWLVALCFSYIAFCGLTRLIQGAEHPGTAPDNMQLNHVVVSRIFIFTTLTSNNFAKLSRTLLNRQSSTTTS